MSSSSSSLSNGPSTAHELCIPGRRHCAQRRSIGERERERERERESSAVVHVITASLLLLFLLLLLFPKACYFGPGRVHKHMYYGKAIKALSLSRSPSARRPYFRRNGNTIRQGHTQYTHTCECVCIQAHYEKINTQSSFYSSPFFLCRVFPRIRRSRLCFWLEKSIKNLPD